jgi:hypothetical protein
MTIKPQTAFLLISTAIILSACAPSAPVAATITVPAVSPAGLTASATRFAASATPSLVPTPEPTATQPLPDHGPYFIFISEGEGNLILSIIGADAQGRKDIPLVGQFETGYCFSCIVSPDGEWLAYWTGYAGDRDSSFPALKLEPPYDLQLNLLHLPDGASTVITALLSPDYPANFDKAMDAIINQPGLYDPNDGYDLVGSFIEGIHSAAWSPDSRYLAFAGEMDGPTSDLYVYDISQKTIRRLSSGLKNIVGYQAIRWSPDGKWIVYSSGYWYGEGMTVTFYAARPDGSAYREYPENMDFLKGWLSDSVFLVTRDGNGIGTSRLESADLESGRMAMIWKCQYSDIAFDPGRSVLVSQLYPLGSEVDCQKPGLYFRSPPAGYARLVAGLEEMEYFTTIDFLGLGDLRYLVSDSKLNSYSVSSTGKSTLLMSEELYQYVAPDRQWVVFAYKGLRIMDSSGDISDPLTSIQIEKVFWRPDSKGFLFLSGPDVYSVSLPEKTLSHWDGIQYPSEAYHPYWQPDSEGYFFESDSVLYYLSLRTGLVISVQPIIPFPFSFDPVWVAIPE